MLNKIPVIGWFLTLIASVSLPVPFWLCLKVDLDALGAK